MRRLGLASCVAVSLLFACTKKKAEPVPAADPVAEPAKPEPVVVLKADPVPLPAPPPAAAAPEVVDAGPQVIVVIDTPPPAPEVAGPGGFDEATWRKRFREAHARVDGFEQRLEDAKAAVAAGEWEVNRHLAMEKRPGPLPAGYEEAKRFVEHADEERKAVNSALDDLDREAANAGVPMEWRR